MAHWLQFADGLHGEIWLCISKGQLFCCGITVKKVGNNKSNNQWLLYFLSIQIVTFFSWLQFCTLLGQENLRNHARCYAHHPFSASTRRDYEFASGLVRWSKVLECNIPWRETEPDVAKLPLMCEEQGYFLRDRASRKLFTSRVLQPDTTSYVDISQKVLSATAARYMVHWISSLACQFAAWTGNNDDLKPGCI